jgi:hypothetical protein
MPILHNPAHELFAQGRALGMSYRSAYRYAGFTSNSGHATRLARKPDVAARIEALMVERDEIETICPGEAIRRLRRAMDKLDADPSVAAVNAVRGCITLAVKERREYEAHREAALLRARRAMRGRIWAETGEIAAPEFPADWSAVELAEEEGDPPPVRAQAPQKASAGRPAASLPRPDASERVLPRALPEPSGRRKFTDGTAISLMLKGANQDAAANLRRPVRAAA